jgi:tripartite-type tricarboxylate transporter receptor subunit TctC
VPDAQPPYNAITDFTPIALLATGPYVLVAHPSLKVKTLAELIALAKAQPGKIDYASLGNGTGNHPATELFKSRAGIDLVHVPYAGAAPATTDLVGGGLRPLRPRRDGEMGSGCQGLGARIE